MIAAIMFAAAFGAVIGSFLNVCIYRIPTGRSVVSPGSACGSCGHMLAWYENIPVVSYVVLRGRCRACRSPISLRYPFVEILTAAMFAGAWWLYGPSVLLISMLLFGCSLIVLTELQLVKPTPADTSNGATAAPSISKNRALAVPLDLEM